MEILTIILSSLALLAALTGLGVTVFERKRSKERNTALVRYVDATVKQKVDEAMAQYSDRVSDLEKGIVPDFEKAKAAANAVNDFSAGVSGILGFDPYEVLKKQRQDGGEQT